MGNRTDHSGSSGTGNRLSSFNGLAITYDADGNVIEKFRQWVSDRHYYWSAESQLDSVIDSQNSGVKYEYNAFGKPVIKSRKSLGGSWSVDSYYLWDGDQLLMELDGSGNRRADYVYYPGTTDTPAAEELGATSVSSFRDHQIDAEGNVIGTLWGTSTDQKVSYDAWGMPTISGNADNRLFWKGLLWEGDLVSLYYVRNRWYDPELGRFASEDPIGHSGGDNLYAFGNNDPVNGSDPSGLFLGMSPCVMFGWCEDGSVDLGSGSAALPPITCDLIAPSGIYTKLSAQTIDLFSPETATSLSVAFAHLNDQGIVPEITSGFRTTVDQQRMINGASGSNPAGKISWHEVGEAVDINHNVPHFDKVVEAMTGEHFVWGGTFRKPDPVHFQVHPAGTSPTPAMINACRGH